MRPDIYTTNKLPRIADTMARWLAATGIDEYAEGEYVARRDALVAEHNSIIGAGAETRNDASDDESAIQITARAFARTYYVAHGVENE